VCESDCVCMCVYVCLPIRSFLCMSLSLSFFPSPSLALSLSAPLPPLSLARSLSRILSSFLSLSSPLFFPLSLWTLSHHSMGGTGDSLPHLKSGTKLRNPEVQKLSNFPLPKSEKICAKLPNSERYAGPSDDTTELAASFLNFPRGSVCNGSSSEHVWACKSIRFHGWSLVRGDDLDVERGPTECTCTCTYVRACIHTHTHTHTHTQHTHTNTHMHTRTHTHLYTLSHTPTESYTYAHTHEHAYTHRHTKHAHAQTHTHTHTYAPTYTLTHTYSNVHLHSDAVSSCNFSYFEGRFLGFLGPLIDGRMISWDPFLIF